MAIDPKLLVIKPVNELQTVTGLQPGDLLFYDKTNPNETVLKKISIDTFNNLSKTAKPLKPTDATPTTEGLYMPTEAGTYTNAGGLVAQEGYYTLFFFDGNTWTKSEVEMPTVQLSTLLDPNSTNKAETGKSIADFVEGRINTIGFTEVNVGATLPTNYTSSTGYSGYEQLFYNVTPLNNPYINSVSADIKDAGHLTVLIFSKNPAGGINILQQLDTTAVSGVNTIEVKQSFVGSVYVGFSKKTSTATLKFIDAVNGKHYGYYASFNDNAGHYEDGDGEMAISVNALLKPKTIEYNLEDFGAVALDPNNPDAGTDCTQALQDCINAIMDSDAQCGVIKLKGMYRIGGDVQNFNYKFGQVKIPYVRYAENMVQKSISIVSDVMPVFEEQLIIKMPVSYAGCGFYSTATNATSNQHFVIVSEGVPDDGVDDGFIKELFQWLNYVSVWMDNVTIITNARDTNNTNTMGGINFENLSHFGFGNLLIRSNVPAWESNEPSLKSRGLIPPTIANHVTCFGEMLRITGFGLGLIAQEHFQLSTYVALANKWGLYVHPYYPASIETLCLEGNKENIILRNESSLRLGILQVELITDTGKWYENSGNIIKQETPGGNTEVQITNVMIHGGNFTSGVTFDDGIDLRIVKDNDRSSRMPVSVWTTATRPKPQQGLEGYNKDLNRKEIYIDGVWK